VTTYGLPGGAFINGAWRPGDPDLPVTDPESGAVLGAITRASAADVAEAVVAVRASLAEPWPLWARRETMERAAQLVYADATRLARIASAEGIKTICQAEAEVGRCVETLRLSAAGSTFLRGETLALDDSRRGGDRIGWFTREPLGVVAAITPFNDPLNLVAHKVGPALIAGNAVVLKPHEETPLSAIALTQILLEAGVPAGRISLICGDAEVGRALVEQDGVDVISFTGGPSAGAEISRNAGPRKLLMELGGDNPTIVCADADPKAAARAVVEGAFGSAGQNCLSVQRVYVHTAIFGEFLDEAVARTGRLRVGSKADRTSDVGPLINERAAQRIEQWVDDATSRGATVHTGGLRKGVLYQPTVLTDVPEDSPLLTEEAFAPVVSVVPFDDLATVLPLVNATGQGALQAGVFTESLTRAMRIAQKLTAGAVIVNGTSDYRLDSMPFGGFGRAGIGREGIQYAIEAMTAPKSILVNLQHPEEIG
jgi:glyceraldehyde-3-phosphate dehydrogenase (NADP+)